MAASIKMAKSKSGDAAAPLTLEQIRKRYKSPTPALKETKKKATTLDKMAVWITERVGTMGFFLVIFVWTAIWYLYLRNSAENVQPRTWYFSSQPLVRCSPKTLVALGC